MARILQGIIIALAFILSSCSPYTTVMVIEVMDGTKYAKCVPMDSTGLYLIKVKETQEGEIIQIKINKLKTRL